MTSSDGQAIAAAMNPLPIIPSDLLMLAYRDGIFPMADARDDPEIFWVEPRQRAILPLDGFHLSHSLAKALRQDRLRISCNEDFAGVIRACADIPRRRADGEEPGSWISHRIEASYIALHRLDHAHSVECWQAGPDGETLVGGLYGVGFGGVFCGESMFSRVRDASKLALAALVAAMKQAGMVLLDCQFITPHLASMGAVEITQTEYKLRLNAALTAAYSPSSPSGAGSGAGSALGAGLGAAAAGLAPLPARFAALLSPEASDFGGSSSSPGKRIAQSFTQTS